MPTPSNSSRRRLRDVQLRCEPVRVKRTYFSSLLISCLEMYALPPHLPIKPYPGCVRLLLSPPGRAPQRAPRGGYGWGSSRSRGGGIDTDNTQSADPPPRTGAALAKC